MASFSSADFRTGVVTAPYCGDHAKEYPRGRVRRRAPAPVPSPAPREFGPRIVVCPHCRAVIGLDDFRAMHLGFAFCASCAILTGVAYGVGVETNPKMFGGHTYRGPGVKS